MYVLFCISRLTLPAVARSSMFEYSKNLTSESPEQFGLFDLGELGSQNRWS